MKKVAFVLLAAATFTACNNSADSTNNTQDSLDSVASAQKENIDSNASAQKDQVDSLTDQKKETADRMDSLNKKDSANHK
jgi:hypothetical protein